MKKFLISLAVLVILVIIAAGAFVTREYKWSTSDQPYEKNHAVAQQCRTSHVLVFYNDSGDARKRCTGTAIGQHVLLTALHCNETGLPIIRLDYSGKDYNILATIKDDRDHVMYLVDGPAFYYIDPYKTRTPRLGENIHIYGFGGRAYPANYKAGKVLDEFDPSEISYNEGLFYTSLKVIPGDSGSAIYGEDGYILGIVSYQIEDAGYLFDKIRSAEFALDNTKLNEATLRAAEKKPKDKPVEAKDPFATLFGMKK